MIQKYVFGTPFETEAVIAVLPAAQGLPAYGTIALESGFSFSYTMAEDDIVYGLGEANRGINKRGYCYISNCTDDPEHLEDKRSFYGAHNFLILAGQDAHRSGDIQAVPTDQTAPGSKKNFGLFIDYPGKLTFDIGYTRQDLLTISCAETDLYLYVIDGESPYDIVKQFRQIIGRSYIPPMFAFGYGQSRWGYRDQKDLRQVADGYRKNHLPIDMIYMDIDYMDRYKDFTVSPERFDDFKAFVREMKEHDIHLIPIIDAGIKIEPGDPVYEEGLQKGFFCQKEDGTPFVAAVWPGYTHFTDFLDKDARAWFGSNYRFLTDMGIEGFWNDMNEPAIFYTPEGVENVKALMQRALDQEDLDADWDAGQEEKVTVGQLQAAFKGLANHPADYASFYHKVNGRLIRHDKVHNLYGYNMTRAAGEAFKTISPHKRILLFSRSSYIGMHRYGGIWMGDNKSWWSHLLLNIKMLPSLNMCGFLYTGADLGGFGADTTQDLLLRWLALGVFTPLMRNHSAFGTREQECYQFEKLEDFRHVLSVRYRLIPYLYSEYMKAALDNDLYFKPLAFVYPDDKMALQVEDQLMLGNESMIAPIYTQNACGRYVYLPEEMKFIKFLPDGTLSEEILDKGHHYVEIALNEVPLFIRKGCCIPVAKAAESVAALDREHLELLGYEGAPYRLYEDDGICTDPQTQGRYRILR